MKSNRANDKKGEEATSKFLDTFFYEDNYKFIRNQNVFAQKRGVDIVVNTIDDTWFCDEKCALDYVNKELKTFAFELRATSDFNGRRYDGWLLSNSNLTTHYNLIYITKSKVDKNPTFEDILEAEIIIVSKKDIVDYIASLGWNKQMLVRKCDSIDLKNGVNMGNINKDGVKFVKSEHKFESPINILLPKSKLIELSLKYETIKRK